MKSDPTPGVLETSSGGPPPAVRLVFGERLDQQGSSVMVLSVPGFEQVDNGDSHLDPADPKAMAVSLKPGLGPGKYLVKWTSVSAIDGRELSGEFGLTTFRTGEAPTPVAGPTKPTPASPTPAATPDSSQIAALLPATGGGFDIQPVLLFVLFSIVALLGGGIALPQHWR
ncbi:MAG: copper resistance protein CopC [Chloroflexi bacterium]|nr:copper resistance protein CopC [Chloroflexota bacterium]